MGVEQLVVVRVLMFILRMGFGDGLDGLYSFFLRLVGKQNQVPPGGAAMGVLFGANRMAPFSLVRCATSSAGGAAQVQPSKIELPQRKRNQRPAVANRFAAYGVRFRAALALTHFQKRPFAN